MRKLKFRAWDNNEKKMFKVDRIDFGILEIDSNVAIGSYPRAFLYNNKDDECYWINDMRDFELMQYSGLKDKTGIEIYESDIIKMFPGFGCEWKTRIGIVIYEYQSFRVKFKNITTLLDDHEASFEIIGNIYENPELKEKENVQSI